MKLLRTPLIIVPFAFAACEGPFEPVPGRVAVATDVPAPVASMTPRLGPNLAPNPSFESGTTGQPAGWTTNPNGVPASFAWSTTFGRTGSSSLQITTTDGSPNVPLANPGWKTSGFIPLTAATEYRASVWTYTETGGVGHIPAIQFFEASGRFLGTIGATGPSGRTDPSGHWVEKVYDFDLSRYSALATATQVRFLVVQDIWTTKGTQTSVYFDDVYFGERLPGALSIQIDVKPGNDSNTVSCDNPSGLIPVAILTTADFDATDVDHATVTFEGAAEVHADRDGVARRHESDVDGDGDIDLVFHFLYGDTTLDCASSSGRLEALTFDGTPVAGSDLIGVRGNESRP